VGHADGTRRTARQLVLCVAARNRVSSSSASIGTVVTALQEQGNRNAQVFTSV